MEKLVYARWKRLNEKLARINIERDKLYEKFLIKNRESNDIMREIIKIDPNDRHEAWKESLKK